MNTCASEKKHDLMNGIAIAAMLVFLGYIIYYFVLGLIWACKKLFTFGKMAYTEIKYIVT